MSIQNAIDAIIRSDLALLDDELRRTGSEKAQHAWSRVRGRLIGLAQEARQRRSEDDTREVPTR